MVSLKKVHLCLGQLRQFSLWPHQAISSTLQQTRLSRRHSLGVLLQHQVAVSLARHQTQGCSARPRLLSFSDQQKQLPPQPLSHLALFLALHPHLEVYLQQLSLGRCLEMREGPLYSDNLLDKRASSLLGTLSLVNKSTQLQIKKRKMQKATFQKRTKPQSTQKQTKLSSKPVSRLLRVLIRKYLR